MRIDVRDQDRRWLFDVEVDPLRPPAIVRGPGAKPAEVYLKWDQALDDRQQLRRCPVCGCRELFVRKDFPQLLGLLLVVATASGAILLFLLNRAKWAYGLLAAMVVADVVLSLAAGRCLVCYRCRSEFRGIEIPRDQAGWDLAIGDKYRAGQS